jgi:F0F1-type ATP synthase membrane subunit b/b'
VKSTADPKLSLLHFFGRLLRDKYPDLLNFYDELAALDSAKRISLQTISAEVGGLRKGLKATAQEAEGSKTDGLDTVSRALDSALSRITPQFEALDSDLTKATTAFTEVVAFYGEDAKTATPEEFFSIIARFHTSLEQVHKDAAAEKERAEKEAKRAAAARARGNSKAPKMGQLDASDGAEATNIMDNLLSDLKSDTMKDTIKAHRSKIHTKPPLGMPPSPMVAAEAMNVVLRKTGGPAKSLPPPPIQH